MLGREDIGHENVEGGDKEKLIPLNMAYIRIQLGYTSTKSPKQDRECESYAMRTSSFLLSPQFNPLEEGGKVVVCFDPISL